MPPVNTTGRLLPYSSGPLTTRTTGVRYSISTRMSPLPRARRFTQLRVISCMPCWTHGIRWIEAVTNWDSTLTSPGLDSARRLSVRKVTWPSASYCVSMRRVYGSALAAAAPA
ncbi:hypothetical protein D9M68_986880 [compost metagenome]